MEPKNLSEGPTKYLFFAVISTGLGRDDVNGTREWRGRGQIRTTALTGCGYFLLPAALREQKMNPKSPRNRGTQGIKAPPKNGEITGEINRKLQLGGQKLCGENGGMEPLLRRSSRSLEHERIESEEDREKEGELSPEPRSKRERPFQTVSPLRMHRSSTVIHNARYRTGCATERAPR